MCLFVTATLPGGANVPELNRLSEVHKRVFRPMKSPVSRHLMPEESYFLTTWGQCDCGTGFACASPTLRETAKGKEDEEESKIAQRVSKGWSQTKIDRWRAQRQEQQAKVDRLNPDCERWVQYITAMVGPGRTPWMGLMVHMYSGDLETEEFEICGRTRVSLADLTPEAVSGFDRDTLYIFSP
jgi:hypothetical protein